MTEPRPLASGELSPRQSPEPEPDPFAILDAANAYRNVEPNYAVGVRTPGASTDSPEPVFEPIGGTATDWHFTPSTPPTPRRQPPAEWGWQHRFRALTGGLIKPQPGHAELLDRQAVSVIRRTLPNGRLIVIANEKGGAGKTPAALILGAIIAQLRSESNVVWDINEMRGNLALRAEVADPPATILDVLANLEFLSRPEAHIGELLSYLRRQPEGHLILASTEDGAATRQIEEIDCDRVLQLLQRRFGLVIADTGNNASAAPFRYALDAAQVLLIPANPSPAHLVPARNLLGAVATRESTKHLVHNAVLVVTSQDGRQLPQDQVQWFVERGVRVMHVPADPAIAANESIPISALSEASRRAWTLVAAAAMEAAAKPAPNDRRLKIAHRTGALQH